MQQVQIFKRNTFVRTCLVKITFCPTSNGRKTLYVQLSILLLGLLLFDVWHLIVNSPSLDVLHLILPSFVMFYFKVTIAPSMVQK